MLTVQNLSHDPFYNQAFEEFVFQTFREDDVFLLWQNSPAVIVGSFQNICREVHVETLRRLSIPIVRRMSGGGTGSCAQPDTANNSDKQQTQALIFHSFH